jgi:uncharacterized protein YkwD
MSLRLTLWLGLAVGCLAVFALSRPVRPVLQAQEPLGLSMYLPLAAKGQRLPFGPIPTAMVATATPAPTDTPGPTNTPRPSPTATPTRTVTPTATPDEPDWQQYVNLHRGLARLPRVTRNDVWSRGGELHGKYMVKNDVIGHSESPGKPFYTAEGHEAAQNGNVAVTSQAGMPPQVPIDMWMTGPFHQLQILNPKLAVSGFGSYSESDGGFQYGATLDVLRGRVEDLPPRVAYPIRYPDQNQVIPNLSYEGGESPDPLTPCPGYRVPTGPPLVLMVGGDAAPGVTKTSFKDDKGTELPHCWFDETKYKGSQVATLVLARDHSVILMPKSPLSPDARYSVSIVARGTTHEWVFRAGPTRPEPRPPVELAPLTEPAD